MTYNCNASFVLVVTIAVMAIYLVPLTRRSKAPEGNNMGDSTPTGNLLLRENHDDGNEENHRSSRNVLRGKGVGSKDVIARQLQRGAKNVALQKLTTKQRMEQSKDEIPANSGRPKGNIRWHHRGSAKIRELFTKAVLKKTSHIPEQYDNSWCRNIVRNVVKFMIKNLSGERDPSLNLAGQLSFKQSKLE